MRESLSAYLDDLGRHPVLSVEEEQSLARAYRDRGDTAAAHRLVTANLRFVVKVAASYRGYGLKLADLIQEGNLGLMRAVEKFDPDQGIRLISYAVWWIRAYIQGYVLQSWSLVKVGTTQAQRRLFFSLARTRRELGDDLDEDELDERVARRLRVRTDDVRQAARRMEARDVSIDAPGATGTTPLERLESDEAPPDELLSQAREAHTLRSGVAAALSLLDERERVIVEERLMADDPASLQDLGARFGFSRERARQIEIRARGKLRLALGALAADVEGVGAPPRAPEPEMLAAG